MKITSIAITLLFLIPLCGNAQFEDVAFLDDFLEECKQKEARYVKKLIAKEGDTFEGHIESLDGDIRAIGFYQDEALTTEHGEFTYYHENGKVESQGRYEYGQKTGIWKRFDQYGNPKVDKIYDASALKNITYSKVAVQPKFDEAYISLSEYVKQSVQNNGNKVKGKLKVEFVVEKDGSVSDIYLIDGIDDNVDAEIINALRNMPKWEPGKNHGQDVRTAMNFEMKF